jgi:hypothetical protein
MRSDNAINYVHKTVDIIKESLNREDYYIFGMPVFDQETKIELFDLDSPNTNQENPFNSEVTNSISEIMEWNKIT